MSCGFYTQVFVMLVISCAAHVNGFYPFHASCKIDYKFVNQTCEDVKATLVRQIGDWNHKNCNNGDQVHQRCRYFVKKKYNLTSESERQVTATHTTPLKLYVDDLTFDFAAGEGSCGVKAFSTSQLWYAFLDFGTNYCNLHNLVEGSGLKGYSEETWNSRCTQYTSADCERY